MLVICNIIRSFFKVKRKHFSMSMNNNYGIITSGKCKLMELDCSYVKNMFISPHSGQMKKKIIPLNSVVWHKNKNKISSLFRRIMYDLGYSIGSSRKGQKEMCLIFSETCVPDAQVLTVTVNLPCLDINHLSNFYIKI